MRGPGFQPAKEHGRLEPCSPRRAAGTGGARAMALSRWSNPLLLATVGLALMVGGWKASTYVPRTPREQEQSRWLDQLREAAGDDPELADRLDDIGARARRDPPYRVAGRVALLAGLMLFVAAGVLMYRQP